MPEELTWNVLLVEDEKDTCRQIKEHYDGWSHQGNRLTVTSVTDFDDALDKLEKQRYDLLILDVFKGANKSIEKGNKAGINILKEVKKRRFIPVVFYTALPTAVKDLENPLIKVAEKTGVAFESLDNYVVEFLNNGLVKINREFTDHVDRTLCKYLWDFVPDHWQEMTAAGDVESLAYLLCRRLAASLDTRGAEKLARSLKLPRNGQETEEEVEEDKAHPMRYYIIPPASEFFCTGDILKKSGNKEPDSYWLILTPECDFIESPTRKRKAEHILLVRCMLLTEFDEYKEWNKEESPSPNLIRLIKTPHQTPEKRQEGRFYFLPGTLGLPDMVVDFQQAHAESFDNASQYTQIATLDNPFRESLVFFFNRYIGRIGTLGLDVDKVIQNLQARKG